MADLIEQGGVYAFPPETLSDKDAHAIARNLVDVLSCYIPEVARGQAIADLAQYLSDPNFLAGIKS